MKPEYERRKPHAQPVMDPVKAIIDQWLEQDKTQPPKLLPLPSKPFPCCRLHPVQANGFGLVTFQTNRYSAPAHHAYEAIWLRAFSDRVEITNGRKTLAVHTRCYDREQDILNPLHYLPLLERRPGAWDNAKRIQEWRRSWPKIYDRYLAALQLPCRSI